MTQDSYLREVFKEPPITAYKRNQNIRGHLIRAKVARDQRNKRHIKGMKKCGQNCPSCPYIKEGKTKRMLRSTVAEHRDYVSKGETDQSTGAHFNKPGHSLADLSVNKHTRGRGTEYRKEREHYFIQRFDTYHRGMNKQK